MHSLRAWAMRGPDGRPWAAQELSPQSGSAAWHSPTAEPRPGMEPSQWLLPATEYSLQPYVCTRGVRVVYTASLHRAQSFSLPNCRLQLKAPPNRRVWPATLPHSGAQSDTDLVEKSSVWPCPTQPQAELQPHLITTHSPSPHQTLSPRLRDHRNTEGSQRLPACGRAQLETRQAKSAWGAHPPAPLSQGSSKHTPLLWPHLMGGVCRAPCDSQRIKKSN